MTRARIKNWAEYQHYKHRSPPWLKLHRRLLDDHDYMTLSVNAQALLPLLGLVASESVDFDGTLDISIPVLAFRIRGTWEAKAINDGVRELINRGFLILLDGDLFSSGLGNASSVPAARGHDAATETEAEQRQSQKGLRPVRSAHRFEDFWKPYPIKVAKVKALAAWKRKHLDAQADAIVADVTRRITPATLDKKWQEGIIPHPTTYLNQERWLDEASTPLAAGARTAAGNSPKVDDTPLVRFEGLKSFLQSQVDYGLITKAAARQQCVEFKVKYGLP